MKKMMALATMSFGLFVVSLFLMPIARAQMGSWATKAPLPQATFASGVTDVGGKVFTIGGQYDPLAYSDANYEYNPQSNTWAIRASMPTARTTLAAAAVNGKIYAIGGAISSSGGVLSTNEEYDPALDSWTTRTPLPTARNWISGAVVNGKIHIIGGSNNMGGIYAMNEIYDPSSDSWSSGAQIPHGRVFYGIGVVNNKIYVIGGWTGSSNTGLNEEYNPQTNTWTTKAAMPTVRNGLVVGVIDNRIYAIGGATNVNPWTETLDAVEEYDPASDTWRTVQPALARGAAVMSATSVGNSIYVIGGTDGAAVVATNEMFSLQKAATLEATPNSGFATTTIEGSGFSQNSGITIAWDGTTTPSIPSPLTTDGTGSFAAMISVQTQTAPGVHTIKATDESGNWASATFTVVDMTGDPAETQLILIAFPTAASIVALCISVIALLRRKR